MRLKSIVLNRRGAVALAMIVVLLLVAAVAVVAERAQTLDSRLVAPAPGPAGLQWIGGNRESPFMNPGQSCIGCHSRGEGPRYQVAGTVYRELSEKDNWLGVEGVTVRVTDKGGKVADLVSNQAGNFFSGRGASLVAPYSVKVLKGAAERAMGSPAPTGDCAACHTAKGANGAPGRVIAP
jgi:mono/diheme cytochrome c family protein